MRKVIDSHCHAWADWPYRPQVPDAKSRGTVEQLLHEMDVNRVDEAVIVCAQIEHNPENNAYVAQRVVQHPSRLHQFADVDSSWSSSHHAPGAADRLRAIAGRWPIKGFTHYLTPNEDGAWFDSADGRAFFGVAAELGLIASLSTYPHQHPWIRRVAERYPALPILIHHLGHVKVSEGVGGATVRELVRSAAIPSIYVKFSGFRYITDGPLWNFPYSETHSVVEAIYNAYGPLRLCWGSDYPVVRCTMTYEQSLEAVRSCCPFIAAADMPGILGGNLAALLGPPSSVAGPSN